jgi:hypothetical protein
LHTISSFVLFKKSKEQGDKKPEQEIKLPSSGKAGARRHSAAADALDVRLDQLKLASSKIFTITLPGECPHTHTLSMPGIIYGSWLALQPHLNDDFQDMQTMCKPKNCPEQTKIGNV